MTFIVHLAYGADVIWGEECLAYSTQTNSGSESKVFATTVTAPHLPTLPLLDFDTSRGKRTIQLDLRHDSSTGPADREKFISLLSQADVFLQAYRPEGLARLGFSPSEVAKINPNIICANLSAWGDKGPWHLRRGFDSLVQHATGINADEAEAKDRWSNGNGERNAGLGLKPVPLPAQALDHASGYLLAWVQLLTVPPHEQS